MSNSRWLHLVNWCDKATKNIDLVYLHVGSAKEGHEYCISDIDEELFRRSMCKSCHRDSIRQMQALSKSANNVSISLVAISGVGACASWFAGYHTAFMINAIGTASGLVSHYTRSLHEMLAVS